MTCSNNQCDRPHYARNFCKLHYEHDRRDRGVPAASRIHNIWMTMKQRCYYKDHSNYPNYGARGIQVYEDWRGDFQKFYDWALAHNYASNLTLDRVNVNGNYEPANCRWITMKEQQLNKRNNRLLTLKGVTRTTTEWAELMGVNRATIKTRLFRGWNDERALVTPVRGRR